MIQLPTTNSPAVRTVALLGMMCLTAFGLMAQDVPSEAPIKALEEVGIDQKLGNQVSLDLAFVDSNGETVQLRELFRGKPVLLTLVYYECPMLCTEVLNGVLRALRPMTFEVGRELDVVTISIDPDETSALSSEKKALYLRQYNRPGSEDGWHFLTGTQQAIAKVTDDTGFRYAYIPEIDQYSHAAAIMLLTPEGQVSRYFFGVEYSSRDLRLSVIEASEEKIGSPVDQVLLYCYHYDPTTGKYSLVIWNVMRGAGILTIVLLAVFIIWNLRRERGAVAGGAAG